MRFNHAVASVGVIFMATLPAAAAEIDWRTIATALG
jgi:hypothetical protein